MKNLIYDIKTESTHLHAQTDEELEQKIMQLKKRAKQENALLLFKKLPFVKLG